MEISFEQFWEDIKDKDIATIADTIIEVFNKPFADEIYEQYDLAGILLDFTDHHETAKKYDKIELFGEAIKHKHPRLYSEVGDYINKSLVKYYCFKGEEEKLKIQFQDFVDREYSYDLLLNSLKVIIYYQYTELANQIIDQIYEEVVNSVKLMWGAESDLDFFKHYIELEQLYINQKNNTSFDFSDFKTSMSNYNFEFENNNIESIEIGLFSDPTIPLKEMFKASKTKQIDFEGISRNRFLRFMLSKNCPFSISFNIWFYLQEYFKEINTRKKDYFFIIRKDSLVKFLIRKRGFWFDNEPDIAAMLWGILYVNEFAFQEQLIDKKTYNRQNVLIKKCKVDFKKGSKHKLWRSSFIHQWLPCSCISLEDWEAEKSEFEASYNVPQEFKKFSKKETDKLFQKMALKAAQALPETLDEEKEPERKHEVISSGETYVNDTKIGRNEKVSVQYTDGTIKKEVKYKKVMQDVESGACEIMIKLG